jgi:hypothetical protein
VRQLGACSCMQGRAAESPCVIVLTTSLRHGAGVLWWPGKPRSCQRGCCFYILAIIHGCWRCWQGMQQPCAMRLLLQSLLQPCVYQEGLGPCCCSSAVPVWCMYIKAQFLLTVWGFCIAESTCICTSVLRHAIRKPGYEDVCWQSCSAWCGDCVTM